MKQNVDHASIKESYAAEGRTYCAHCGNSDADMDIDDDICYDCKHPEETSERRKEEMRDHFYVFGDNSMDY